MVNLQIRPAQTSDQSRLAAFLNYQTYIHRHLDWRNPMEWLGTQPFLLAEGERNIEAVLACPQDPPGIAWIRVFACSNRISLQNAWKSLFSEALSLLRHQVQSRLVALALQDWFEEILRNSGFNTNQNIVVLEWNGKMPTPMTLPPAITIRRMQAVDLPAVKVLDQLAFDPLWHNSLEALTLAYKQSSINTVAVNEDRIIGYQISTSIPFNGHLARLAVDPALQGQNVGYNIVHQLLKEFRQLGIWRVTVNTQSNNFASLALYQKIGFVKTGEAFPVYEYPLDHSHSSERIE